MLPSSIILDTKKEIDIFFEKMSNIPVLSVTADEVLWNILRYMYVNGDVQSSAANYAHDVIDSAQEGAETYNGSIWFCIVELSKAIYEALVSIGAYDEDGFMYYEFDQIRNGNIVLLKGTQCD